MVNDGDEEKNSGDAITYNKQTKKLRADARSR